MPRQIAFVSVIMLALVAMPAALGQTSRGLKPRLDAIVRAQEEANRRYSQDLQGKPTDEAWKAADDRYDRAMKKNTDEVLDLVRARPKDPFVVEALKFVITTALRGPGESQEIGRLGRDHLAVLVRRWEGWTDHDAMGRLVDPDELCLGQGRRDPLQGRAGPVAGTGGCRSAR